MLSYARVVVERAENAATAGATVEQVLGELRKLPLDDFAEFMFLSPNPSFPSLGRMLPRMASVESQEQWTGTHGYTLLRQTLAFVRLLTQTYAELKGRSMAGVRLCDFGCGYGRMLRPMYYYSDPGKVFACDPWDRAIELCRADGLWGTIRQSDYLPVRLPFEGTFDLIYAFSVFTHLSRRATLTNLLTLAGSLERDGLLVITIRPIEYWDFDQRYRQEKLDWLKAEHERVGFAFVPHGMFKAAGEDVYGDTSLSLEFLAENFPQLELVRFTRTVDDPHQIIVFLRLR